MRQPAARIACLALTAACARADIYLHNPRGSNNRLEKGNGNRNNANRLFDSENNAAGGYGMGGSAAEPAPLMKYIVGSELTLEWTSQHSCGHNNAHCQFVFQYYCHDDPSEGMNIRDGSTTDTISEGDPTDQTRGLHEPYAVYEKCKARERNKGLWTADQNLNGREKAVNTRQEPAENRHGFECPEERDYYPYWHPSVWKDIVVLTTDADMCNYYKEESFNVQAKNECSLPEHNNERACVSNGGEWLTVEPHGIDPPKCMHAPWLRDNHLGNSANGRQTMYNWTIPDEVSDACILRARYNISTQEVPWNLDGRYNNGQSPIQGNPRVDLGFGVNGGTESQLELAVNTNQYGRTFQDRSFAFRIVPRPSQIGDDEKIYNINVRGKRGNIVQTYPAVEYDFSPKVVSAPPGSWFHFQWTGNDKTANNGANNGEGTDDTDRHNLVQIEHPGANVPMHKDDMTMFDVDDEVTAAGDSRRDKDQLAKEFALAKQEGCRASSAIDPNNDDEDADNCEKLNAAPATVDLGLLKLKEGTYHFMSTRNNNFSNRSQKGAIHVQKHPPPEPIINVTKAIGVDSVSFTWTMPDETKADGAIDASEPVQVTAFEVDVSEDGGDSWNSLGVYEKNNETSDVFETRNFTLSQLPAGITYAFRVSAQNKEGWSRKSQPATVMTKDSERSIYYKSLLRNAVAPYELNRETAALAIGFGAGFLVLAYLGWNWHSTGSVVPRTCLRMWRICRYGSPEPPQEGIRMLDISKSRPGGDTGAISGTRV